jgi:hypothetical protein
MIRRREFITLLGGAAAAWPLAARAQQAGKLPVIGFLGPATAATQSQWAVPMVRRLRELNWIEGRNIVIEYRWAEGRAERAAEVASEFVRSRVDVIVTIGTPTTTADGHFPNSDRVLLGQRAGGDRLGGQLGATRR